LPSHVTYETAAKPPVSILVGVQLPGVDEVEFSESLAELGRLASTFGAKSIDTFTQRRESLDIAACVGPGRVEELAALVKQQQEAEPDRPLFLFVDHEITPRQVKNLQKATGAEVLDRTSLILEIFQRHAKTREAKAQVEIVRLRYSAPRLREKGGGGDRVRGGVGGKGAGETALELDRRKIRDRIAELKQELAQIESERKTQRDRRKNMARVALVGYTNAGKSTLMRALTGSEVYVADKLFATLDTTVRTIVPETNPRILVSDTVGFIRKLPHDLVASFRSTLEEVLEASLVAHVVDASDVAMESQRQTTLDVLGEIGAGELPRLLVLNKMDRVPEEQRAELLGRYPDAFCLSAKQPEDVARFRLRLVEFFAAQFQEAELALGYDQQHLRGEIFSRAEVLEERYEEEVVVFRLRGEPSVLEELSRKAERAMA
jgi:GTP-binding protein HflX